MREKNPLDVLFKDIKRQMWEDDEAKRRAQERARAQGRVHVPPRPSTYANPLNWTLGKVIEIVHATEGSLGTFQEYFHKLSPTARRLLPAAAGLPASSSELVFGEFWLHPKFSAAPPADSELEVLAIQSRFRELMDRWAEGEALPGWLADDPEDDDEDA